MNLLLSLALLSPAHALIVKTGARPAGTALVSPVVPAATPEALTAARTLLTSPSSPLSSLPAVDAFLKLRPDSRRADAAMAPFAAALAESKGDAMAAMIAASRGVSAQAEAMTSQTVYPQDGVSALERLARDITDFAEINAPYLSAARQVELKQAAYDLRAVASGNLTASVARTAEALGSTPEPGAVAAVPARSEKSADRLLFEAQFPELVDKDEVPPPAAAPAEAKKSFSLANVVAYTGGGLVMTALGWFLFANLAPAGAGGVLAAAVVFAGLLGGAAVWLQKRGQSVPAGVLYTAVVAMVPVAVVSVFAMFDPRGFDYAGIVAFRAAAVATIAAAVLLAQRVKFAFLAMPAALMAWGLSIDAAVNLLDSGRFAWEFTRSMGLTSALSGGILMAAARWIETRTKVDYPFWLYLAGLLAFSGGLALMPSSGELGRFAFAMIHLGLVGTGLYLNRKTFAVFGYIGFNAWVVHLAWKFGETYDFALGLGGAGAVLIATAVVLNKYGAAFGAWLRGVIKHA